LATLCVASPAWAAGNVAAERSIDQTIEVIIVTAKRLRPEPIDVVVVTPRRPNVSVDARVPPAMPIEMPRLEFAVAEPPVVQL
jgi:hypothetical protein